MIVGGIDVGSRTMKAVLFSGGKMIRYCVVPTNPDVEDTAARLMTEMLSYEDLSFSHLDYLVATGYGRVNISFAQKTVTEISCHSRGTNWMFPTARTILDVGGQDCKAILCGNKGQVENFVINDKCAAGTGRYLERIAMAVGLPLEAIGEISLKPINGPEKISSFCAVFAEADVIRLVRQGKHLNDILAGACEAIVSRIVPLVDRMGLVPEFSISGGVARNIGIVRRLEERFRLKALIAPHPEIIGAIGAALFALGYAQREGGILT